MARSFSSAFRSLAIRRSNGALKSTNKSLPGDGSACSSRCETATVVVAVVGVGYVGLGLVRSFSAHYRVIALDVSLERICDLRNQWAHLSNVEWTTEPARIGSATHILIAVPTPLTQDKTVDTTKLIQAIKAVRKKAQRGSTVVIESSVAVGMTRELLGPTMKKCGFKGGMSPERVDPGRKTPAMRDIPKVISGLDDMTPGSLQSIQELYAPVFGTLVPVSSPEVAEMTKLYENCQRIMAISFANEMADACVRLGIDPYEVSEAAATKPFGYLPVTPGIGVGGHCIPVNPYYLFSKGSFPLLEAATEATERRPAEIGDRMMASLLRRKPDLSTRLVRVLVVGIAFKPGESLTTNSPGLTLMYHLNSCWHVSCQWYDPLVGEEMASPYGRRLKEENWATKGLEGFDLIVVAMKQRKVDWNVLNGLVIPQVEIFCPI